MIIMFGNYDNYNYNSIYMANNNYVNNDNYEYNNIYM